MTNDTLNNVNSNGYKRAFKLNEITRKLMREEGVPCDEVLLATADFLILSALAAGHHYGISVLIASSLIDRQLDLIEDWHQGRSPFTKFRPEPTNH